MRCIHCLNSGNITKDHVFPKSWYPDNTPIHIQRLTAPSCKPCNALLGEYEKKLFIQLALCINPNKTEAQGISRKLHRSLGIGSASHNIEANTLTIRHKTKQKIIKNLIPFNEGVDVPLPGFGVHTGSKFNSEHVAIPVPEKELHSAAEKIIRGTEYNLGNKRYIEPPYRVNVYFPDESKDLSEVNLIIEKHAIKKSYGPGFLVERAAADDHYSIIYRITLWGTLIIHGIILNTNSEVKQP